MDWITQSKYIKLLIGILLAVNIITISIIWILIFDKKKPPAFDPGKKPPGVVEMIKKEIGLSDAQAKQFERLRKENFDLTNTTFKKMDGLKKLLSEEFANETKDTALIHSLTNKMGILISELERQRIKHFSDLLSFCTKEQKEKLKPILKNMIGGKPPQENQAPGIPPKDGPMPMPGSDRGMPPPPPEGNQPKPF